MSLIVYPHRIFAQDYINIGLQPLKVQPKWEFMYIDTDTRYRQPSLVGKGGREIITWLLCLNGASQSIADNTACDNSTVVYCDMLSQIRDGLANGQPCSMIVSSNYITD